ncbi:MAG: metal-sulfur cluster assembly factor [Armatimonadetes bacterium]|nr:metal-sulfur cluster assembly factor [Armatimonadota bacterium]
MEALTPVSDPELGISIVDLGLVYGFNIDNNDVTVKMTLTSPACPLGAEIMNDVKNTLEQLPFIKKVDVELVWSPRWDPRTMASEDARMELGIF